MKHVWLAILAALLLLLLLAPFSVLSGGQEPQRKVGKGVNLYSLEKEIALGKQMAQEVEREARIVDDPSIAEYVNRLGQNLARNSDLRLPVTAKTIDSEEINAFALPGGFLFVNTGLLMQAGTEAELAAVMAHEIAHVAARHGTRQASRGTLVNIASVPLIFLGGWAGYGIRQAAGLAIPMTFLKFSRGFEEEADRLGLEYLYNAGYDPPAFVDFLEKLEALQKRQPGALSQLFRSHPPIPKRIQQVQKQTQELLKRQPQYVVTTSEFAEVQAEWRAKVNRRHSEGKPNVPTLRRPHERPGTVEDGDERPTLSRRPPAG